MFCWSFCYLRKYFQASGLNLSSVSIISMNKLLVLFGVIIAIGVGYWLVSPLFIDKEVSESIEDIMIKTEGASRPSVSAPQEISMGTFVGLAGHDSKGTAKLIRTGGRHYIRFEDDFSVTNGPDLFVYLGKDGQYDPGARLEGLKGNLGSQNYEIPLSITVSDYNEVWVWCRAFSVPFGKAELKIN